MYNTFMQPGLKVILIDFVRQLVGRVDLNSVRNILEFSIFAVGIKILSTTS